MVIIALHIDDNILKHVDKIIEYQKKSQNLLVNRSVIIQACIERVYYTTFKE